MKRWCFDIDNTICEEKEKGTHWSEYSNVLPVQEMVDFVNERYELGDYIILSTARHMASTDSNLGLVNSRIGLITYQWLEKHGVKFHEIYFSKPYADYYVDDKSIRPYEVDIVEELLKEGYNG
jgi:capsule biosynthesis phosphatase